MTQGSKTKKVLGPKMYQNWDRKWRTCTFIRAANYLVISLKHSNKAKKGARDKNQQQNRKTLPEAGRFPGKGGVSKRFRAPEI